MKTADKLKTLTRADLAQMAKKRGVPGWHGMRKDQLVRALSRAKSPKAKPSTAKSKATSKSSQRSANGSPRRGTAAKRSTASAKRRSSPSPVATTARRRSPSIERKIKQAKAKLDRLKNLSGIAGNGRAAPAKDRLVVMVRDPYWLHAYWELTRQGVERAEAALNQQWHGAKPALRVLDVSSNGTTSSAESVVKHIEIHGGVNNWYVHVDDPPRSLRLEIGYLAADGTFFSLARSNVVTTPRAGVSDSIDENWSAVAENFEKVYAMSGGMSRDGASGELRELFEERLRRPMGSHIMKRFSPDARVPGERRRRGFHFDLEAELIVYGSTDSHATVTLLGDPVELRPDGSFTVRFSLPNCRQVIPAVATRGDGGEERTVVLAVERNTKIMEPIFREDE